jgi:hypothetical protein
LFALDRLQAGRALKPERAAAGAFRAKTAVPLNHFAAVDTRLLVGSHVSMYVIVLLLFFGLPSSKADGARTSAAVLKCGRPISEAAEPPRTKERRKTYRITFQYSSEYLFNILRIIYSTFFGIY